MPLLASVICAEKLSVPLLATAAGVPVKINVQLTLFEVVVGLLHAGVIPVGRPEAIATLAPAAFEGTVTPPVPVAVTTTDVVPMEDIAIEECDNDSLAPGVCAKEVAVMPQDATSTAISILPRRLD
jgi:hypothetical protein